MNWDLPENVIIDGKKIEIRDKCDYRVILDVIVALNDVDLTDTEKIKCALYIFYKDLSEITDYKTAVKKMIRIINYDEEEDAGGGNKPRIMDWEYDFRQIAPAVSRVLGYDVRTPGKYTHWYTFLGAYMEIGECTYTTIINIRTKRSKGQKLDKWELDFMREHPRLINLPQKMTAEEKALLNSAW